MSPSEPGPTAEVFTSAERALLEGLQRRQVRFMVVGMSAALLQGARGATEDIDLWFENPSDVRIADAVRDAGGIWIAGHFGMEAPRIGGDELNERFDVVTHMSGLDSFAEEACHIVPIVVDGVTLPVLDLRRLIHSKRSAGRPKDLAALPALEDALALLEIESRNDGEAS